jgi:hypothetical protein
MNARRSIFGPLSIGLPLLGLGIEIALVLSSPPPSPNPTTTTILFIALGTFVLGLASGIVGSVREERMRRLPAIGIGLNILLVTLHFLA